MWPYSSNCPTCFHYILWRWYVTASKVSCLDEKFLMTLSPVYSVDVHTRRSPLIGGMVHDPPIGIGRRFSCECQPSGPRQIGISGTYVVFRNSLCFQRMISALRLPFIRDYSEYYSALILTIVTRQVRHSFNWKITGRGEGTSRDIFKFAHHILVGKKVGDRNKKLFKEQRHV